MEVFANVFLVLIVLIFLIFLPLEDPAKKSE